MNHLQKKWIYLIILSFIWGSSFILIKKSIQGVTPFQLGSLRTIISALFLFIVGYKTIRNISKTSWKWLALSGFLGSFIPAFLFAIAETEIDSNITSVLNSLVPLNTLLTGIAVFKITTTKKQVLGVIIGFAGTVLLILKGAELNSNQNYWYAGFVIASTIMYAINVNVIKLHLQHLKPLSIATGNYVVIFIPAIITLCYSNYFSATTFQNPDFGMAMFYILILSFFGTALAKVLFNKLIQLSTPIFASSVTYLMPLVAIIWGLLDGEKFTVLQAAATVIILFGVYLSQQRNS